MCGHLLIELCRSEIVVHDRRLQASIRDSANEATALVGKSGDLRLLLHL